MNNRHTHWRWLKDSVDYVLIEDIGPWANHLTITNDAEWVVKQMQYAVGQRRLYYLDSEGKLAQLYIKPGGTFGGFGPIEPEHQGDFK